MIFSLPHKLDRTPLLILSISTLVLAASVTWVGVSAGFEFVMAGFGALILVALLLQRPLLLIALVTLILSLNQTYLAAGNPWLTTARWIVLSLGVLPLVFLGFSRTYIRNITAVDMIAALFTGLALYSSFYSPNADLTLQRALSIVLLYMFVFWMGWHLANEFGDERITRALMAILGAIYLLSILSILFTGSVWQSNGRFRGLLINPNSISLYASVFSPLFLWRWFEARRWVDLILVITLILCVVLSGSRNGFLVLLFSLTFFLYFTAKRTRTLTTVLALTSIAFLVLATADTRDTSNIHVSTNVQRLFDVSGFGDGSGRLERWTDAWQAIQRRLWQGYGFGIEGGLFHNSYLGILFQLGIPGLVLMFFPLPILVLMSWHKSRNQSGFPLTRAYEGVIICGLISSMFESWPYSAGNAFSFPFWMCVMLLLRQVTQRYRQVTS